jgi:hypothetical protein
MQAVECHVLFGSSPALERFVAPREPRPVRRLRRVARSKCREWLMAEIEATCPRDHRTAEPGFLAFTLFAPARRTFQLVGAQRASAAKTTYL